MINSYEFGYPEYKRSNIISDAVASSKESMHEEYHGKYRALPVVEIRIEALVYRMENIRTKNLQKEWLAQHPDLPKDLFTCDPFSIEAQENQHQILKGLAKQEGLLNAFKDSSLQQKDAIICSDNGIVVNGNRRLCAWRELYYSDKTKYKHFETVRIAVLPDHDPEAMYDLEVALQIHSDMKAEYTWHAIAADCKEKTERGISVDIVAAKQGKSVKDIGTYIECYDYASEYLEGIGRPDEWTLVDKQYFAFQKIVQGRKSLTSPGDKELFQEIAKSMLQTPAKGDRLYNQIPEVVKNLDYIAPKLKEAFGIETESDEDDDELDVLSGNDDNTDSVENANVAAGIRKAENPTLVVDTVKIVLDTRSDIEKEKKKKSFILDQVTKAATCLNNAVSNIDDLMSKDGVARQLESIEATCIILKDWIK